MTARIRALLAGYVVASALCPLSFLRAADDSTEPTAAVQAVPDAPAEEPGSAGSSLGEADQPPAPALDDAESTDAEDVPAHRLADVWTAKRLTGDWGGVRTELEKIGFSLDLEYQHQWQQNFRGGLDTRNACRNTGSYDLVLRLDFNKMGLIPAEADFQSGFYIKAKGSYNRSIQDRVGSLFNPNADPVGRDKPIYVNKWWFWSKFFDQKLEIRLGVLETVKDLIDVSLYANHEDRDFLNQASYRNILIPHTTGMGALVKLEPVDGWYLQGMAVDAQARQFRTQFDTAFHNEAWYLGFFETGLTPDWKTPRGPMPGRYRIGLWYNPRKRNIFEDLPEDSEPRQRGDDVGFYLGLDQMVWKENDDPNDKQGLGLFTRFGASHGDINRVNRYWQIGASYRGLLPGRDDDVFGFSWANALLSSQYRREIEERADAERVFEWYYAWRLTPWLIISPDLQVITNPGGLRGGRDAIAGGIRLQVVF